MNIAYALMAKAIVIPFRIADCRMRNEFLSPVLKKLIP